MLEDITFADLEKLLFRLGFVSCETAGTQRVFRFPALNVLIILPAYKSQDPLHPVHVVSVRKALVENGLITPAAFDGFTEKINL